MKKDWCHEKMLHLLKVVNKYCAAQLHDLAAEVSSNDFGVVRYECCM